MSTCGQYQFTNLDDDFTIEINWITNTCCVDYQICCHNIWWLAKGKIFTMKNRPGIFYLSEEKYGLWSLWHYVIRSECEAQAIQLSVLACLLARFLSDCTEY